MVSDLWAFATFLSCWFISLGVALLLLLSQTVSVTKLRFASIHGLRGVLSVCVAFHHSKMWQAYCTTGIWGDTHPLFIFNLGSASVRLFFMISGTVFYSKISRIGDIPSMICSRVFRIMPLYWFALLVATLLAFAHSDWALRVTVSSLLNEISTWAFLQGTPDINKYGWSNFFLFSGTPHTLVYEWKYYACIPILGVLPFMARITRIPILLVLLLCTLAVFYVPTAALFLFNSDTSSMVVNFLLGMIAVEIVGAIPTKIASILEHPLVAVGSLYALGWLLFNTVVINGGFIESVVLFLVYVPLVGGNSFFGFLHSRSINVLGTLSYSIYLMQGMIFNIVFTFGNQCRPFHLSEVRFDLRSGSIYFASSVVVTVILLLTSLVTWKFVELPGIALGKRILSTYNESNVVKVDQLGEV
jgi:peptidoglycan/LPS O-acetylase OafA/YrhL